jgi:hypothetical protein
VTSVTTRLAHPCPPTAPTKTQPAAAEHATPPHRISRDNTTTTNRTSLPYRPHLTQAKPSHSLIGQAAAAPTVAALIRTRLPPQGPKHGQHFHLFRWLCIFPLNFNAPISASISPVGTSSFAIPCSRTNSQMNHMSTDEARALEFIGAGSRGSMILWTLAGPGDAPATFNGAESGVVGFPLTPLQKTLFAFQRSFQLGRFSHVITLRLQILLYPLRQRLRRVPIRTNSCSG